MKDPRFPELSFKQVRTLKSYGTIENHAEGTKLFETGQNNYDFFVILSGCVDITNPLDDSIIVSHQKHEFSGDSGMLSNRGAQFDAIAGTDCSTVRINGNTLKSIISKYSDISDTLLNAFLLRQETVLNEYTGGIRLVGSEDSHETYEIRDFLEKNHIWYKFLNIDRSEEAKDLISNFNLDDADLPILLNTSGEMCANPSLEDLARHTGVLVDFEDRTFDVLVIGAGPAGLAASVYASSEGLDVVTIDSKAPGGQAGKSSKIENYLGFPTGISGGDLANRAYVQAQKFGCNISIPHKACEVRRTENCFEVEASNQATIRARAIIVATGANYRKLPIEEVEKFEGSGIYYSATGMNISSCEGELIGVIGGGNSAGQAALFLAQHAKKVYILIRGNDLAAKMSDYLVQRIEASESIELLTKAEITTLHGMNHLERVTINHNGEAEDLNLTNVFTFIGAKPCTEWIDPFIEKDKNGFICTGSVISSDMIKENDYAHRSPQTLETSVPGFFAVGDVRNGSVKRVASAVGEGSMAVSQVHLYLSELAK